MNDSIVAGLAVSAVGLFSVLGAAFNWDFFMNNRKAVRFVSLFGRNGARAFYGVLGALMILAGLGFASGLIPSKASRASNPVADDAGP